VARATKADPIDYAKQMEFGRKLATAVNRAWEKLEADQAEAKRVSSLKDKRIADLTAEIDRIKKDAMSQTWTLVGAGLAVIGALTTAFLGPRIGIPLLLCGAFCGSVPFIIDSPYFEYIAGRHAPGLLWPRPLVAGRQGSRLGQRQSPQGCGG
jgi:hypothetical protein